MNFFLFPRMAQYDYVVWLDGTIEVHSSSAALVTVYVIIHTGIMLYSLFSLCKMFCVTLKLIHLL
jgi:hypothetical protein